MMKVMISLKMMDLSTSLGASLTLATSHTFRISQPAKWHDGITQPRNFKHLNHSKLISLFIKSSALSFTLIAFM